MLRVPTESEHHNSNTIPDHPFGVWSTQLTGVGELDNGPHIGSSSLLKTSIESIPGQTHTMIISTLWLFGA